MPPDIPRNFLIEEPDACTRKGEDLKVVVFVHSAIKRVEQRHLTRYTWANSTALNMTVVFMVGRAKDNLEKKIVRLESELYHDIVQVREVCGCAGLTTVDIGPPIATLLHCPSLTHSVAR